MCEARARGFATTSAAPSARPICPALVGTLSNTMPLGQTIGWITAICHGLVIIAALALPETLGRELSPGTETVP
ncbi:hypothetical protein SAMN05192589_11016 [Paracidovorax valerianellae]|uniref:Uncharacterized protein n=1 Tax=Paracidovorax valerianellae TaxID=187868 RepID=A0A1G6YC37_9BURK|nr:hypothetical protein SAMN05192589_11016 [Paracidovorax valerianellae]